MSKPRFTPEQKRRLMISGPALFEAMETVCLLAKPFEKYDMESLEGRLKQIERLAAKTVTRAMRPKGKA